MFCVRFDLSIEVLSKLIWVVPIFRLGMNEIKNKEARERWRTGKEQ